MKKKLSMLIAVLLFFTMTAVPEFPVFAASLSVAVSNSDLNIGDTCSVTVTVPNGGYAQVSIAYDSDVLSTDGGQTFNIAPNDSGVSQKTITFKAVGAGTASISANCIEAVDAEENETSFGSAGASVSVANQASSTGSGNTGSNSGNTSSNSGNSNSGNSNNGNSSTGSNGGSTAGSGNTTSDNGNSDSDSQDGTIDTTNGDNSLSALSISGGSLSPAFAYNVTKYTAEVDYSVTSVAVSATPSNPSATVASVTGNKDLQVGANTITIVVKAGNGVTATYTINVTRKTEDESDNNEEENPDEDENGQEEAQNKQFSIGGKNYTPAEEIPEEVIPADFGAATVAIDGKDYACLNYTKADMTLLYMTAEGEEGGSLFIYHASDGTAYPFVELTSGSHYIIVLMPEEGMIPSGYNESALQIEGKGQITVYQKAGEASGSGDSQGSDSAPAVENTENNGDDNSLGFYQNIEQMFTSALAPERVSAAEMPSGDFYLLYALNDQGETYWYQYDNTEGTYQRYARELPSISDGAESADTTQDADQVAKLKQKNRYLIFGMIFGAAVLLIIIVNLLIAKKDVGDETYDEDDEDDEDEEEEEDDEDDEDEDDDAYDEEDDDTYELDDEDNDDDDAYEEEDDEDDEDNEDSGELEDDDPEASHEEEEASDESEKENNPVEYLKARMPLKESYEPENLDNTVSLEAAVKAIQTMVIPSSDDADEQFANAQERVRAGYHEENVRVVKRSRMDKFLDKKSKKKASGEADDDDDLEFLDIK